MITTSAAIAERAPYHALVRPRRGRFIDVLDQRALPHAVVNVKIADADAAAIAIRKMMVRGAPLIGAVGAYGLALALDRDASDVALAKAHAALDATRPTAVNLRWALDRIRKHVTPLAVSDSWTPLLVQNIELGRSSSENGAMMNASISK